MATTTPTMNLPTKLLVFILSIFLGAPPSVWTQEAFEIASESSQPTLSTPQADTLNPPDKATVYSDSTAQFLDQTSETPLSKTEIVEIPSEATASYEIERLDFSSALDLLRPEYATAIILNSITSEDIEQLLSLPFETALIILHSELVLFSTGNEDEIGTSEPGRTLLEKATFVSHIHSHFSKQSGPSPFDLKNAVLAPAYECVLTQEGAHAYNQEGVLNKDDLYSLTDFTALVQQSLQEARALNGEDQISARAELNQFIREMDLYNEKSESEKQIFRKGVITVGPTGDFVTVGDAILAAQNGDTIEIQPGVYHEGAFDLNKTLVFRGLGGPGSVVFDGQGFTAGNFMFLRGDATFENVTFRNYDLNPYGGMVDQGGVFYAYWNSRLTLRNTIFDSNAAHGAVGGGAVFAWNATLLIYDSVFNVHYARKGGAILSAGSHLEIHNSTFFNNGVAFGGGSALKLEGNLQTIIQDTVFENNRADSGSPGGVLYATDELDFSMDRVKFINNVTAPIRMKRSTVSLDYVLIEGSSFFGGSAATFTDSNTTLNHATISANGSGPAIRAVGTDSLTMTDSIIYGNPGGDINADSGISAAITNSLLQQPFPGAGNITGDPLFSNPSQGDYRISYASPAKYPGTSLIAPPIAWGSEGFVPDTVVPTGSIQIVGSVAGLEDYTDSLNVTLQLQGVDNESGLASIEYSLNGGASWIEAPGFSPIPVTLPSAVEKPEVRLRLTDYEGNQSEFRDHIYTQIVPYLKAVNLPFILTSVIDGPSEYPHDNWSNLAEFTQPTHIGFHALLLANLVSGDLASDLVTPEEARDRLNTLMTSLLADQNSIGYLGLLPWLKFNGTNRIPDTGPPGQRIIFGDNANLSSALATAYGALVNSTDPMVVSIRNKIDAFLANQADGYALLYDNVPSSSKYQLFRQGYYFSGPYAGQYYAPSSNGGNAGPVLYQDYLGDEFRDGILFVMLRYNYPDNAYLKMDMQFKHYNTLASPDRMHVIAPFKGGAFQALWPLLTMPENWNTGLDEMLKDFVTIALDYSSRNNLPGFLAASYEACPPGDTSPSCLNNNTRYSGNIGISQIAVNTDNLNQQMASLYTLGAASMVNPTEVETLLTNIILTRPSLVTNHGLWEGYDTAEGQIVQEQVYSNIATFTLGLVGRGPNHMYNYLNDKGYYPRLQTFFESLGFDTVQDSYDSFSWSSGSGNFSCGSNACKKDGDRYFINASNADMIHTAFKLNSRNIKGNKLVFKYQSNKTVDGWIEFKKMIGGNPIEQFRIPNMRFLQTVASSVDQNDPPNPAGVREITIGFPPNIDLSDVDEIVFNLDGPTAPLQFMLEEMDFLGSGFGTGGGSPRDPSDPSVPVIRPGFDPGTSEPLGWLTGNGFLNPGLFAEKVTAEVSKESSRGSLISRDEQNRVVRIEVGSERFDYEYDLEGKVSELIRSHIERVPKSEPVISAEKAYLYQYDFLDRLTKIFESDLIASEQNVARNIEPLTSSDDRSAQYTVTQFPWHLATNGKFGDEQVGWVANLQDADPYLSLDLGETKEIHRVRYDNRFPGYNATRIWQENFTISGSLDGVEWFSLTEQSGLGAGSAQLFDWEIKPVQVRFIKVHHFQIGTDQPQAITGISNIGLPVNAELLTGYVTEIEVYETQFEPSLARIYEMAYSGDADSPDHISVTDVIESEDLNVAQGLNPTASSDNYRTANRVTDGAFGQDQSSSWLAFGSAPYWLQLDLGEEKEIGKLVLDSRYGYPSNPTSNSRRWLTDFRISGSLDGENWFELVSKSGLLGGSGQIFEFTINPATMRYVRVHDIYSSTSYGSFAEIQVFENAYELTALPPDVSLVSPVITADSSLNELIFNVDGVETVRTFDGPLAEGENLRVFEFQNEAGATTVVPVTIVLDTTAPALTGLALDHSAEYTISTRISASLEYEHEPGLSYHYSLDDGKTWTDWAEVAPPGGLLPEVILDDTEGLKTVLFELKDPLGNISAAASDDIFLDWHNPTAVLAINGGNSYTHSPVLNLSIASQDGAGSGAESMRFSANGGNMWSDWEDFSVEKQLDLSFWQADQTDGLKEVRVETKDRAGLVSSWYLYYGPAVPFPLESIATITLDRAAPTGAIQINSNAVYTHSTTVTIAVTASDATSGVSQMQFSLDGGNTWTDWEDYSQTKTLNLPAGDGIKTITARIRDRAGNVSGLFSDQIILDTIPPTGSFAIVGLAYSKELTLERNVSLSLSGGDAGSGPVDIRFSADNGSSWTEWKSILTPGPNSIALLGDEGQKTVLYQMRDKAGNITALSDTIFFGVTPYLNSLPPNSSSVDKLLDVQRDFDIQLALRSNTLPRRDYLRLSGDSAAVKVKIQGLRRNFKIKTFNEIIQTLSSLFDQIGY